MGNSLYTDYDMVVRKLIVVYNSIYEEKNELDKELEKNLPLDQKNKNLEIFKKDLIDYLDEKDKKEIIKNAEKAYKKFRVRPDLCPKKVTTIPEFKKKIDVLKEIQKNMDKPPEKFYNELGKLPENNSFDYPIQKVRETQNNFQKTTAMVNTSNNIFPARQGIV